MSDLGSHCEKWERDIERLRCELDALRLQMLNVVVGVLARVDGLLAKVEADNRQMFSDLKAQTDRNFADLHVNIINALPLALSQRKNDEPPKLN
jgi:hypothetical protein